MNLFLWLAVRLFLVVYFVLNVKVRLITWLKATTTVVVQKIHN
ncbi:hypothetical protein FDI23_gp106 [Serratia phage CHI14]|uniref:Uncharacterized protein n=2 Tax=Winklervirus chi14 TaxID=2560752 RepID=A0A1Z1LY88_9CAUD|nr:hypothetical protein FDI23_gp106 [Serratia phage CHI14]ARW57529.1 hypothetical protein [Serratia phage CHI14]ARW57804.1 hypothetical protein [Serratia phage CBH8]